MSRRACLSRPSAAAPPRRDLLPGTRLSCRCPRRVPLVGSAAGELFIDGMMRALGRGVLRQPADRGGDARSRTPGAADLSGDGRPARRRPRHRAGTPALLRQRASRRDGDRRMPGRHRPHPLATRETTLMDLVVHPDDAGGLSNVATVAVEIGEIDVPQLARLAAVRSRSVARRLGWLLDRYRDDLDPEPLREIAAADSGYPTRLVRASPHAARSTTLESPGQQRRGARPVIDRPALIAWRSKAPWPNPVQIEQDLLLSRLMIEIARDDVLGPELAMRGGTCLHKLHLPTPLRYSEDLDYVRKTHTGIKPYTQALGDLAERLGLTVSSRQRSGQMVHVYFDATADRRRRAHPHQDRDEHRRDRAPSPREDASATRSRPPGGTARPTSRPTRPASCSRPSCARSTNAARDATSSTSGSASPS